MQKIIDLTCHIPPALLKAGLSLERMLEKNGFEVFLVGGSVRDLFLQKKISDLDFTTNARPEQVMAIFKHVIPVGIQFGTVIVISHGIPIEVTTYRSESGYIDGRRPQNVSFGNSLAEDITRRDFTVNGLAYHLQKKILYDFCNGLRDIETRTLRAIGNADERFREDGLRPIRACRFAASGGFVFHADIPPAVQKNFTVIAGVARERFYDEWRKSLNCEFPFLFWQHLFSLSIFSIFFASLKKINSDANLQNLFLKILQEKKNNSIVLQCATLWFCEIWVQHDSKKKFSLVSYNAAENFRSQLRTFFKEHRLTAKNRILVQELLFSPLISLVLGMESKHEFDRLNFTKALSLLCGENHKYQNREKIFLHLRFFSFVLPHFFPAPEIYDYVTQVKENITSILRRPLSLLQLNLNGNDLKNAGYTGKDIGVQLQKALSWVLENPQDNQKEILLQKLKN